MKYTLLILSLFLASFSHAQSTMARYTSDSTFTVKTDSNGHLYVNITPVTFNRGDTFKVSTIYIQVFNDYGLQPVTGGTTYSGAMFFTIGSYNLSMSVNNITSNDYDCYRLYGWKFLFWDIADAYLLNIQ